MSTEDTNLGTTESDERPDPLDPETRAIVDEIVGAIPEEALDQPGLLDGRAVSVSVTMRISDAATVQEAIDQFGQDLIKEGLDNYYVAVTTAQGEEPEESWLLQGGHIITVDEARQLVEGPDEA